MAFDTRLRNERKVTCPKQDLNPRLPVTSRAWYLLHHRVNHTGCMANYWCAWIERSQSTGHFSVETFVCIMAKSQIFFISETFVHIRQLFVIYWQLSFSISKAFLALENFCLSFDAFIAFKVFNIWQLWRTLSFRVSCQVHWPDSYFVQLSVSSTDFFVFNYYIITCCKTVDIGDNSQSCKQTFKLTS